MKTTFKYFCSLIVITLISGSLFSQIAISNVSEISKIKQGTTYVVMKDPNAPIAKAYIDVFNEYWTFNEVKFIKNDEVEKYLAPDNSFFSIGNSHTEKKVTHMNEGISSTTSVYAKNHVYFELWTCDEKYFGKESNKFDTSYTIQIARLELYTILDAAMSPILLTMSEYDGGGFIHNWSPGILKNDIQTLMTLLDRATVRSLDEKVLNLPQLKKLNTSTLYVPDYVLIKYNNLTGSESELLKEKVIFKNYELNYEIVSMDVLSKKIIEATGDFYYLILVKSEADKYINVINGHTGEIIYSDYAQQAYNINAGDLSKIVKTIN